MCMSHSDDLIWFGTSQVLIDKFINLLRNKVPMTPTTYSPSIFRGIEIIYHKNGDITLHQSAYIKRSSSRSLTLRIVRLPLCPAESWINLFNLLLYFKPARRLSKSTWYDKVVFSGLHSVLLRVLMSLIGLHDTCKTLSITTSNSKKVACCTW